MLLCEIIEEQALNTDELRLNTVISKLVSSSYKNLIKPVKKSGVVSNGK